MSAEKTITILAQAFYSNRTQTRIKVDNIDRFILGYLNDSLPITEEIDRTIIKIPNTTNLFMIYNKHQESEKLKWKKHLLETENYVLKPLATIPEINLELYSRCIVCRINDLGEYDDLTSDDYDMFIHYLAN